MLVVNIYISFKFSARENKGTLRDNQGVDWDLSIPLKLYLTLDGNGHLFPQTSAYCRTYFPLWILAQKIPFPFFYEVIFIDKTNLHIVRHFIAFAQNIRSRLALMRTSRKTDFCWRDIAKNNFSGIDISQGLDLEPPSLSPYFLLVFNDF